ncbi:unnamed protein product [Meloidogyne enterolobii]|uniref:Uncharacterized protein n=1 Tax=Meloidogyne enterolobii TaxID=390850 RepID=A0ACB0XUI9_MELEN
MKIFLTIFLLTLLVAVSYGTEMGVENSKGIQETEEIKGVNGKIPHGRHKRWWGGWYGGGCCGGGWGW